MTDKELKEIREKISCPQFNDDHYGEWGILNINQRRTIKRLLDLVEGQEKYIKEQQAEIERLTTIAKKMHSWIFTNSYDEEKAYAECGLTDEENTLLGYCGKIVFESKEMVGEQE